MASTRPLGHCFNAFRTYILKKSLEDPFSRDDIIRFFDAIIGKLCPSFTGKPAPNHRVITNALHILASYESFTYPESVRYKLTPQEGRKLETFVDDAIKEGRLTKGRWTDGFPHGTELARPLARN